MKKTNYFFSFIFTIGALFFLASCSQKKTEPVTETAPEWTDLLDKELSQWRVYQSYDNIASDGTVPLNADGTTPEPIGYDKNVENVYSVTEEAGELLLHISGKIYGCIFTKQDYRNYHLKLQYKFGTEKYPPRLEKARDSGILYHSQGEAGIGYWRSWMLAQEFQVMEGGTDEGVAGDYWPVENVQINIRASRENEDAKYAYNPEAALSEFGINKPNGYCAAGANYTSPAGEWTTLELICYEGKSLHIVNGKVAMALENSSYWNGSESLPLTEGKIQLQSESAEIFYKNIQIKEISEIPSEFSALFSN
jgi:hypothetical protein